MKNDMSNEAVGNKFPNFAFSETVSICVTAYNAKKYIARCLKSIIAQTYPHWELVIVDNGSADGTYDEIVNISENDQRIKLFRLDKNRGAAGGFQFALERITGSFYMFVDADDWLEPECLEISLKNIEKYNADILTFRFRFYFGNGKYQNDRFNGDKVNILTSTDEILCTNFEHPTGFFKDWAGVHWGKLFRAKAMTKSDGSLIERGYKEFKIGFCEDDFYTTKCCLVAKKYIFLDNILYNLNREGNSTTVCKTKNDAFEETFLASQLIYGLIPKKENVLSAWSQMFSSFLMTQYITCEDRNFAHQEIRKIKSSDIFFEMKKYFDHFERKRRIKTRFSFAFPKMFRFFFLLRHNNIF